MLLDNYKFYITGERLHGVTSGRWLC